VDHTRLVLHRLRVADASLRVVQGTVLVVRREGAPSLDWEVVAHVERGAADDLVARGRCAVEVTVVAGAEDDGTVVTAELRGPAAVVRVVDDVVVLRGDGPLGGFDPLLLDTSG